jgi:type IV secretory pathway component VirB8
MNYQPRALLPEEQQEFQANVLSLVGEIDKAKRQTGRVAWFASIGFAVFGLVGVASYASLLPYLQERVSNHWIVVDQVHGYVGEVTPSPDAPRLFNARVAEAEIKRYVELWVEYTPQTDARHYALVQLLSGQDQRARYLAWHDHDPLAPRQKLQTKGSVDTDQFYFHPEGTSQDGTQEYRVQFHRRETNEGNVGPWEQWTADVQFHWEPNLLMTDKQVQDNPTGIVVTYAKADRE